MNPIVDAAIDDREPAAFVRATEAASGRPLADVPVSTDDEVARLVSRARSAQQAWAVLPVVERARRLLRLRDAIVEGTGDLLDLLARERSIPRQEAMLHEVGPLVAAIGWCAENAPALVEPGPDGKRAHRGGAGEWPVARGVVGVVSSWRTPLAFPLGNAVQALVAGSGCVLKPSPRATLVPRRVKALFDSTGLPEDLLGVAVGPAATADALVRSGIDACFVSGSVGAAERVAAACGAHLVPWTARVGGKAVLVACEDADVEHAARAIVYGAFAGGGQSLGSIGRVVAHRSVARTLVARVVELAGALRLGDPAQGVVDVGAVVSPTAVDHARLVIEDATGKGARLVRGGKTRDGSPRLFEPTVLVDADTAMRAATEDVLAPFVTFFAARDDDEAVALVRAGFASSGAALGPALSVFTQTEARARRVAERTGAHTTLVNDVVAPFACDAASLRAMSRTAATRIDVRRQADRAAYWFPYSAEGLRRLQREARSAVSSSGLVRRLAQLVTR